MFDKGGVVFYVVVNSVGSELAAIKCRGNDSVALGELYH